MSNRGHTAKYTPLMETQVASPPRHLSLVQSEPSQGVGVEAMRVNELFEHLAVRMNATETLARAVLKRLAQSAVPMEYKHVEGRFIRRMEVQYRNVGRLPPREVPFEDIDE